MKIGEQVYVKLIDDKQFIIECIRKDKPRYTYHEGYIIATNDTTTDLDLIISMGVNLIGCSSRCIYNKKEYPGEFESCFSPYFEVKATEVRDTVRCFEVLITFPYDD